MHEPPAPRSGRPIPEGLRQQLERSYAADLSAVTVHEDDLADQLGVAAVTRGLELHFARGIFEPDTEHGRHIIAHEAAHVVQQGPVAATGAGAALHGDVSLEREAELAARAALAGAPATLSRGTAGGVFQGFDNWEHKLLGDAATGAKTYTFGTLVLTHGDLVSLSGDYFDVENKDAGGDGLFGLASIPSFHPGKQVGTQDEVIAAMKDASVKTAPDARFEKGGIWGHLKISDEVMTSVTDRSKRLALTNREHFAKPEAGRAHDGIGDSAGGSYRGLHEWAIRLAYAAGKSGKDSSQAMMMEACAEHFLTDAFSAGHMRTPRYDVQQWWDHPYPHFGAGLQEELTARVIAGLYETVSEARGPLRDYLAFMLGGGPTMVAGIPGALSVGGARALDDHLVRGGAAAQIASSLAPVAKLGFGDLVSSLLHDEDNTVGLWVENDVGGKWRASGDKHLLDSNLSVYWATTAIQLGVADVDFAFQLGRAGRDLDEAALYALVQHGVGRPAVPTPGRYGAEQVVPRPCPGANGEQAWAAASFDELLSMLVRSDVGPTYAVAIFLACQPGGEIYQRLADSTPDDSISAGLVLLSPRAAFVRGVLDPMQIDPIGFMRSILARSK